MKNNAEGVALPGTKTTYTVTQIDAIRSARALYRPVMYGEDHSIALSQRDHFRP